MNKEKIKEAIDREVNLETPIDAFFGRIRKCKFCKTKTEFDFDTGERYCSKGCFRGNRLLKKNGVNK